MAIIIAIRDMTGVCTFHIVQIWDGDRNRNKKRAEGARSNALKGRRISAQGKGAKRRRPGDGNKIYSRPERAREDGTLISENNHSHCFQYEKS